MNLIKLFTITIISLLVSSCGLTYKVLLGVDTSPEWKTDEQILKQAKKYDIPGESLLLLDTATYKKELKTLYKEALLNTEITDNDSSDYKELKKARNDDFQPAQFRLFDQNGIEIFKLVNCYLDPPIPINWNVDNCFDTFPPRTSYETLNIHMFELGFLLSHSRNVNQDMLTFNELPKANYYGVIIWNDFFKRPSKRLIHTVREYVEKSDKSISLIYINNHNQYLWSAFDAKTKEEIKNKLQSK